MRRPTVAVAVPAFNEGKGIAGFLEEIDEALSPHVQALRLVVVDDASVDDTASVLQALAPRLQGDLELLTNSRNRGHGPSLMAAYEHALGRDPDYVLHVDGDGQFLGIELRRNRVLLLDDAHAVCGVRRFRQDPWFRMLMTGLVRQALGRDLLQEFSEQWAFVALKPCWSSVELLGILTGT